MFERSAASHRVGFAEFAADLHPPALFHLPPRFQGRSGPPLQRNCLHRVRFLRVGQSESHSAGLLAVNLAQSAAFRVQNRSLRPPLRSQQLFPRGSRGRSERRVRRPVLRQPLDRGGVFLYPRLSARSRISC